MMMDVFEMTWNFGGEDCCAVARRYRTHIEGIGGEVAATFVEGDVTLAGLPIRLSQPVAVEAITYGRIKATGKSLKPTSGTLLTMTGSFAGTRRALSMDAVDPDPKALSPEDYAERMGIDLDEDEDEPPAVDPTGYRR
jgi:hypothetical protein